MNQSAHNLLPFAISYVGFEKDVQLEMDRILKNNNKIFQNFLSLPKFSEVRRERIKINLQVVHLYGNFDAALANFTANDCTVLCVTDPDSFEKIIEYIKTGFEGCICHSNLFQELVPAIISVLEDKIYVSPSFFPVFSDGVKNADADRQLHKQLFTQRERILIQLLTTGALYKQIADTLDISENTVRSHVRHIYGKLNVHSKTELTMKIMSGKILTSLAYFFFNSVKEIFDDVACLCY